MQQGETKVNDKKVINGWAIYDWANSAYFLVISTAIFPAYFIEQTDDIIRIFGYDVSNSTVYAYAVAFSYFVITLLSPILSGIADFGGKRMFFLKLFTIIGSVSCIVLSFFTSQVEMWLGTSAFILATIGAAGGLVFYNAYLPEIVTKDKYDRVSARGFAFGYIGSVLLLVFILFIALKPSFFGIPDNSSLPYRIGFVLVGLWWLGFAQITFKRLPSSTKGRITRELVVKGFEEIKMVFGQLRYQRNLKRFLVAVFFYNGGVQTVIYLATVFAKEELSFSKIELIEIILILQILAILGAYVFALFSDRFGNKLALIFMVLIWIAITMSAYFIVSKWQFYILAGCVGLVLGGIQSISRSSYSKLIDRNTKDMTSYFSFYDIVIKISIIVGTFSFGFISQTFGGLRPSVLGLAVFFIVGLIILLFVRFDRQQPSPSI